jgi:tetratricopeptide (TPR) repeat protein
LEKAKALAAGGHADADLRRRVEEALACVKEEEQGARRRAEQAEKHRLLLARLEEIRLRLSDVFGQGPQVYARAARDCRDALRANDLDVDALDDKTAVARLRALPPAVAQALVAALDDWVFVEFADYWTALERKLPRGQKANPAILIFSTDSVLNRKLKVWRRRLDIAQGADADPVRKQLRDAVKRVQLDRFKKIVESEDVAALPAPTVRLSAEILFALGDADRAAALLRQARERRYTGDFWITYRLAFFCAMKGQPAWDDAVRYATASVALRPSCVEALRLLGYALAHRQDTEGAIAAFRQLLRVKKDDVHAHRQLGALFDRKGDLPEAASWYRKAVALDPENFVSQLRLGRVLWRLKDLDGAAVAFRAAVRLRPQDAEAQRELDAVLAQQRKR